MLRSHRNYDLFLSELQKCSGMSLDELDALAEKRMREDGIIPDAPKKMNVIDCSSCRYYQHKFCSKHSKQIDDIRFICGDYMK